MRRAHSKVECFPLHTYNDLPTPQGCWREQNTKQQRQFMAYLLAGVAYLTVTLAFGFTYDMFDMNWTIPEKPAEIDNYKK